LRFKRKEKKEKKNLFPFWADKKKSFLFLSEFSSSLSLLPTPSTKPHLKQIKW